MFKVLRALFFLILLLSLVLLLDYYPGRVHVTLLDYQMELPLVGALLAVVLTVWIILVLYRSWYFIWTLGARYQHFKERKRKEKGNHLLMDSFSALLAGQQQEARDCARLSSELISNNAIAEWIFAQTAENNSQALEHFEKLYNNPRTTFMGLKGLIDQAKTQQDQKKLWALLKEAYHLRPDSPWVRHEIITNVFKISADSHELKEALSVVNKVDRSKSAFVQAGIDWIHYNAQENSLTHQQAISLLDGIHKKCPKWVVPCVVYSQQLLQNSQESKAKKVLAQSYEVFPHRSLAAQYVTVMGTKKTAVDAYQSLLEMIGDKVNAYESQYSLALAALNASLWGAAKDHISFLLKRGDTKEACTLMAKLNDTMHTDSLHSSQEWLHRAIECEGEYKWTCKTCSSPQDSWNVLCQVCHEFDTLEWKLTHQPYRKIDHVDIVSPTAALSFSDFTHSHAPKRDEL